MTLPKPRALLARLWCKVVGHKSWLRMPGAIYFCWRCQVRLPEPSDLDKIRALEKRKPLKPLTRERTK